MLIEELSSGGPIIGIDINGRKFSYAILSNGEIIEKGGIIDLRT